MKIIIRYAIDNCIKNAKNSLLNVIMTIITFVSICIAIFIYEKSEYNEITVNRFFKHGIDSVGIVKITDFTESDNIDDLYNQLNKLDEIDSAGSFSIGLCDFDCFKEIIEIQKKHIHQLQTGQFQNTDTLKITTISDSLFDACNIKLYKGSIKKNKSDDDDHFKYIYLGYGFKDIPIGTRYEEKNSDNYYCTYEVAGILNKHQNWISTSIWGGDEPAKLLYSSEYEVFITAPNAFGNYNLLYTVKSGKTNKLLENKIKSIAKNKNINIELGTVRGIFNNYKIENKIFYNYLRPIIIILVIVCITVMTCLQIVNSYLKVSELGILYSFGIKKTYYFILFEIQNGFISLISFVFSGIISKIVIYKMYKTYIQHDNIIIDDIFYLYTLPKVLLVGVIIVTASSFITYMIMRRYTAREMISNNI